LLAAEFDADQQDWQTLGVGFLGIASVFDLLQGLALPGELDNRELTKKSSGTAP